MNFTIPETERKFLRQRQLQLPPTVYEEMISFIPEWHNPLAHPRTIDEYRRRNAHQVTLLYAKDAELQAYKQRLQKLKAKKKTLKTKTKKRKKKASKCKKKLKTCQRRLRGLRKQYKRFIMGEL